MYQFSRDGGNDDDGIDGGGDVDGDDNRGGGDCNINIGNALTPPPALALPSAMW